jgi:regulator of protease activity HflC (stomatin/prohibitin superfamily)
MTPRGPVKILLAASGPPPAGLSTSAARVSDPAQESLVRALRASFNILRALMVVLVVLYLLSGIFRVAPGQQGLVARLGELRLRSDETGQTPVFPPGWHPALPDPFDKKYILTGRVQELAVTTFMFSHEQAATARDLSQIVTASSGLTPGVDGAMLTGDRNLSHGRWEVQYHIDDAARFLQNVGESPASFEPLLQRLTESAVVREVAGRTVEEVTRTALDDVRQRVQTRLQASLDELETGVEVVQVVAYTIEPGAVRPAFMDVVRAENERLSLQEKAEEEAAEILNRAAGHMHRELLDAIGRYGEAQLKGERPPLTEIDQLLDRAKREGAGEVAVKLSEAEARADQTNERLRSEFEEFNNYLEQRRARPRITVLDLWVQMRHAILSNRLNEIFFVPHSKEIEILIKSDAQRKIELEEEAARKRESGPK